jgi:hypothetical protein
VQFAPGFDAVQERSTVVEVFDGEVKPVGTDGRTEQAPPELVVTVRALEAAERLPAL